MVNNKQKELNKIIDNCISCCITKEGTNQVVKEKVLGKARSINIVMTRCVCVKQLLKAGFNVCTIAEVYIKLLLLLDILKIYPLLLKNFLKLIK